MASRKRNYITPPVDASSLKGEPISDDVPFEGAGLVYSEGEWKPAAGGAGGGASVSASYVTIGTEPGLTSERVLTAGTGIALVDNGPNSTVVINVTGEAVGADYQASFVVMGVTSSLPFERALAVGTGIRMTDGGPGGNVTLAANDSVLATISGSTFTGPVNAQITGSITRTAAGTPFITAPASNIITVTTGSAGQIILSGNVGNAAAPNDISYLVLTASDALTNERRILLGHGLRANDDGPGGNYNMYVHDGTFASLTGSVTFAGSVTANEGFSGSLTRTTDGRALFIEGQYIRITSGGQHQAIYGLDAVGSGQIKIRQRGFPGNDAQFLVLGHHNQLHNDWLFRPVTGLRVERNGWPASGSMDENDIVQPVQGNQTYDLHIDDVQVAMLTGSIFTGFIQFSGSTSFARPITGSGGFSGSLTQLADGRSYLVAGDNVIITSQSNGQVTIAAGVATAGQMDRDATYLVLSATGSLNNERVITTGTGLKATDAGAGGAYTLSVHDGTFAALSGANFTGVTTHAAGLSGSLTRLHDGRSFIVAGSGITINSSSYNGQIEIIGLAGSSSVDAPVNATYLTLTADGTLTAERVFTAGAGLKTVDGGAGGAYTVSVHDGTFAALSGANFTGPITFGNTSTFNIGLTGSLTRLINGQTYMAAGDNIVITSASNGQVNISAPDVAPKSAQYVVLGLHNGLSDERNLTPGTGLKGVDGGPGGNYTLSVHDGTFAALSGANFTGNVAFAANATFNGALTGSLTKLVNGKPFITALPGNVITVTTSSEGQIILSGSGGTGGGGGAPTNVEYLVLTADGSLTNERVFTPSTGLKFVDAGANGAYTLSVHDGTFAALSGANFTGPVSFGGTATFNGGLTGSLTRLGSGAPFITALPGNVITITTSSTGQIIFSGSGGSGGAGGASVAPNEIRNDAYGRLEFYLTSSLGGVGLVTAVPASRTTITHATHQLFITGGAHQWLNPNTLTASMVVTASTVGCIPRDHMTIFVADTNYTLTVSNGGSALGTIFSSSIAGTNQRAAWDIVYDGANWVLGSVTRLA